MKKKTAFFLVMRKNKLLIHLHNHINPKQKQSVAGGAIKRPPGATETTQARVTVICYNNTNTCRHLY